MSSQTHMQKVRELFEDESRKKETNILHMKVKQSYELLTKSIDGTPRETTEMVELFLKLDFETQYTIWDDQIEDIDTWPPGYDYNFREILESDKYKTQWFELSDKLCARKDKEEKELLCKQNDDFTQMIIDRSWNTLDVERFRKPSTSYILAEDVRSLYEELLITRAALEWTLQEHNSKPNIDPSNCKDWYLFLKSQNDRK